MEKILTTEAAQPGGPYSQAIKANGFVFVAGQLPFDRDRQLVGAGDAYTQTQQAITNLEVILKAAGSSLSRVVKVTSFLADWADFPEYNRAYAERFTEPLPARSSVQIAFLPAGVKLEIECIALAD